MLGRPVRLLAEHCLWGLVFPSSAPLNVPGRGFHGQFRGDSVAAGRHGRKWLQMVEHDTTLSRLVRGRPRVRRTLKPRVDLGEERRASMHEEINTEGTQVAIPTKPAAYDDHARLDHFQRRICKIRG